MMKNSTVDVFFLKKLSILRYLWGGGDGMGMRFTDNV